MLNIPEAVQNLFKQDGVPKQFRVHFPNGERADIEHDQIVEGSVKFTESVSSKDVLQFGLAEASEIQFECVGVENIYGATIQCATEILVGDADGEDVNNTLPWLTPQYVEYSGKKYYRIPYGEFIVESCPRKQGAMKHRRVQGYCRTMLDSMPSISAIIKGVTPYKSITITDGCIKGIIDNSYFTQITPTVYTNRYMAGTFFNSSGREIVLACQNAITIRPYEFGTFTRRYVALKVRYEIDDTESYALYGQKIAEALSDKGYDLTYGYKGVKLYNSNLEALQKRMPYLFTPSIYVYENAASGDTFLENIDYSFPAGNNEMVYLVSSSNNYGLIGKAENGNFYDMGFTMASNNASFVVTVYSSLTSDTIVSQETIPISGVSFSGTVLSATAYQVPDEVGYSLVVSPTLKVNNYFKYTYGTNGNSNKRGGKRSGYAYYNSASLPSVILGFYELQAKFGRVARDGTLEAVGLLKSNPVSIPKSDYEEMWWDEYSIDDIGSVQYTFGRDNEQYEYVFGSGQSVYDMRDNYLLQHLSIPDGVEATDYINGLIDTYFVPNITDISFVPVDLEARGLPYLEAGDYIVIDDDDGGTVGTYILNRTISGEMYLEDSIESQGGEIVGSDVRSV